MKRFWMGWYSEATDSTPYFPVWITGQTFDEPPKETFVGLLEAQNQEKAWDIIETYYPDYEERFCEQVAQDWQPGERFQVR